ncbi:MAG: S24 family peptidase, partial [Dehalococcoidia bacterium]|nr:S24 family peptidase [Dehalococcoidia bacterium]
AYIARGDCLEPEISDGNIIIIDRDGQIEHGDIVACLVKDELHLARLKKIAGEIYLENNHGRMKLEECQVVAPVIQVRRDLK